MGREGQTKTGAARGVGCYGADPRAARAGYVPAYGEYAAGDDLDESDRTAAGACAAYRRH